MVVYTLVSGRVVLWLPRNYINFVKPGNYMANKEIHSHVLDRLTLVCEKKILFLGAVIYTAR